MKELIRLTARTAGEILSLFELSDEARPLANGNLTPAEFIQLLVKNDCYNDAVKFLAHSLPKRESVWWACLAAKRGLGDKPMPDLQAALHAAEQWAISPSEDKRRVARAWSEKTGQKSAASWAATAAFWTGGSMAKPGEPEIPVPPFLYAHAVSGAVCLAAFEADPEQAVAQFKRFIRQGLDLAAGGRGDVE